MESAMSEATSYDAMLKALQRLKRIRKLEGTVVIKDGDCLSSDTLLAERQVVDFVIQIKALLAQYRNSGSPLNRALFNFGGGSFFVFNLSPYIFCLFFGESEDALAVENAAEDFLEEWKDSLKIEGNGIFTLPELKIEVESSAKDEAGEVADTGSLEAKESGINETMPMSFDALDLPTREAHFKNEVKALFMTVLSAKQISQLLDPDWRAIKAIPYDSRKEPPEKEFGKNLISQIRDRRIRKQLSASLDDLVLTHYGQKRGGAEYDFRIRI